MAVSRLFRGRFAAEMGPRSCGDLVSIMGLPDPGLPGSLGLQRLGLPVQVSAA